MKKPQRAPMTQRGAATRGNTLCQNSARFFQTARISPNATGMQNTRPFEGLVFCIPVALGLILAVWKKRAEFWQRVLPRVAAPLCVIGALCGFFMAYYNVRGTGHPFLFPYSIYDRTNLTTGAFVWQALREPFQHSSVQLDDFYNGWARTSWFEGRVNSFDTFCKATI